MTIHRPRHQPWNPIGALEWLRESSAYTHPGRAPSTASLSVLEALLGEDVDADIRLAREQFAAMLASLDEMLRSLPDGAIREEWQRRRQQYSDTYSGFSRSIAQSPSDADRTLHLRVLYRMIPPLDLRVRVARLRQALAGEGIGNGAINDHFRSPVKAHGMSVAWHIIHEQISIADIRRRLAADPIRRYRDRDGNVWYQDGWSANDTRENAERVYRSYSGGTQLNYAIEGYAAGDARRLPNSDSVPVSSHVSGMAVDVSGVEWASDKLNDGLGFFDSSIFGGDEDPWSPFGNALVTEAGLNRPYTPSVLARGLAGQAEPWHFELLPATRTVLRRMPRPFTIHASVTGDPFQVPAGYPRLEVRPSTTFILPPARRPGMGDDIYAVMLYGPGGALGERRFKVGRDGLGVWLDLAPGDYHFEVTYRSTPVYHGEQIDGTLNAELVTYTP